MKKLKSRWIKGSGVPRYSADQRKLLPPSEPKGWFRGARTANGLDKSALPVL